MGLTTTSSSRVKVFTLDELVEKLDGFHQLAIDRGHDNNKVGKGRNILTGKFKDKPTDLYNGLAEKYPSMLDELGFLKEWEEQLRKLEEQSETRSTSTTASKKSRSRAASAASGVVSPVPPQTDAEAEERLESYYRAIGNTDKINSVPKIWEYYKKQPAELRSRLVKTNGHEDKLVWLEEYIKQHGPDVPRSAPPGPTPEEYMQQLTPRHRGIAEELKEVCADVPGAAGLVEKAPSFVVTYRDNLRGLASRLMEKFPDHTDKFRFLLDFADELEGIPAKKVSSRSAKSAQDASREERENASQAALQEQIKQLQEQISSLHSSQQAQQQQSAVPPPAASPTPMQAPQQVTSQGSSAAQQHTSQHRPHTPMAPPPAVQQHVSQQQQQQQSQQQQQQHVSQQQQQQQHVSQQQQQSQSNVQGTGTMMMRSPPQVPSPQPPPPPASSPAVQTHNDPSVPAPHNSRQLFSAQNQAQLAPSSSLMMQQHYQHPTPHAEALPTPSPQMDMEAATAALIAAGWAPPPAAVPAHAMGVGNDQSPFFPGTTRDRAVSVSPNDGGFRPRRFTDGQTSWSGGDSTPTPTLGGASFKHQLVSQIRELQEIHKELATHQQSQMELLAQQQLINSRVYQSPARQEVQQQPQQPQQSAMTANSTQDDTRLHVLEEEMARVRGLCSQLMGLVQTSLSGAATPALGPQPAVQTAVPSATATATATATPQHTHTVPKVTPPVPGGEATYTTTASQPQPQPQQPQPSVYPQHQPFYAYSPTAGTPPPVGRREDKKGFFSGLFRKRERSPKREKRQGTEVERFRERVLQAEELIRQFKKISKTTEREPSSQLRQDRLYVQEQLATLSRALKEEAKDLRLLPPTPPGRRQRHPPSYNASSPSTELSTELSTDDFSSYDSQSSPSVSATSTSLTEDTTVSRGTPRRAGHRRYVGW